MFSSALSAWNWEKKEVYFSCCIWMWCSSFISSWAPRWKALGWVIQPCWSQVSMISWLVWRFWVVLSVPAMFVFWQHVLVPIYTCLRLVHFPFNLVVCKSLRSTQNPIWTTLRSHLKMENLDGKGIPSWFFRCKFNSVNNDHLTPWIPC